MTILSSEPISDEDQRKIADILHESQCPHESLRNTFPRYTGLLGDIVIFDDVSLDDIKGNSLEEVIS